MSFWREDRNVLETMRSWNCFSDRCACGLLVLKRENVAMARVVYSRRGRCLVRSFSNVV